MAEGIVMRGGGGISSDDLTAKKEEVLQGKTALTVDSDDEAIEGAMPLLEVNTDVAFSMNAFQRSDHFGQGKIVDSKKLGRGIAIALRDSDKRLYALDKNVEFVFLPTPDLKTENIRAGKGIAGVEGSIQVKGNICYATGGGHFNDENLVINNIPEGLYEALGVSWGPAVHIPIEKVREILGISAGKISAEENIAGVQGSIPVWDANKDGAGNVLNAVNDEIKVHEHPSKGRGIAIKLKENSIIKNAGYVYAPSNDLKPENILTGKTIAGVQGAHLDLATGRVVFNGATFDGTLVSGVAANRGIVISGGLHSVFFAKTTHFTSYLNAGRGSRGVNRTNEGGIILGVYQEGGSYKGSDVYAAAIFDKSIDLTPFSRITMDSTLISGRGHSETGGTSSAVASVIYGISIVDAMSAGRIGPYDNYDKLGEFRFADNLSARAHLSKDLLKKTVQNEKLSTVEVNISKLKGQHFIVIGVSGNAYYGSDNVYANISINKVELIN